MKMVVFGCRGKKEKRSVEVGDHDLWCQMKKRAWQELAKKLDRPIVELKNKFCSIKPYPFEI